MPPPNCPHCGKPLPEDAYELYDADAIQKARAIRNVAQRERIGLVWNKHNPMVKFCRCQRCMKRRAGEAGMDYDAYILHLQKEIDERKRLRMEGQGEKG